MQMEKKAKTLCVHDGLFHADEVTATALLLYFNLIEKEKVSRSRNPKVLAACEFVCDVGGIYCAKEKRFDHHQAEYQGDLSSAGMVLAYLQDQKVIDRPFYEYLNHSWISGVDAHDNGRSPQIRGLCTFSHLIAGYNPISALATPLEQNEAFLKAVDLAYTHLHHLRERFNYELTCRTLVQKSMDQNKIYLDFDQSIPWFESFFALGGESHQALFVVMPTNDGYKLRGIPPNYEDRMQVRLPLPDKWAGLLDHDLKVVSGIEGAVFCHKGRFTSVWKSKADALQAMKMVLKMNGLDYENNL